MCLKGSCRRAACVGHQHGGLNLHKALSVKITANGADDLGALYECVAGLGICDKVNVTLTVTCVGVGKAVILFGEDLEAL